MSDKSGRPLAIVALSGGMDSCVTAAVAARNNRLALLHVTYGQRTATRERRAFDEIADFYEVPDDRRLLADIAYLADIGGSSLTDPTADVPPPDTGAAGVPSTYVPFRNTHILSIAVSWAEVIGAKQIYLGAVEQDRPGYPDCRAVYFEAAQRVVDAGTKPGTDIRVETPLLRMSKADVVRKGVELGAPLHLTWSCYRSEKLACGNCESCVLRRRAFSEAGVPDPIPYQDGR